MDLPVQTTQTLSKADAAEARRSYSANEVRTRHEPALGRLVLYTAVGSCDRDGNIWLFGYENANDLAITTLAELHNTVGEGEEGVIGATAHVNAWV